MNYLSDTIQSSDIDSWFSKNGCKILIAAQTGAGKSHFIKKVLSSHCNGKILLVTNRQLLRQQVDVEIRGDDITNIDTINYQGLEIRKAKTSLFSDYEVIVFDEAHYLFSDAMFSRNTDMLLNILDKNINGKIFIYMTATPEVLLTYHNNFDFIYSSGKNYNYIDKLYFFNRDSSLDEIIDGISER